MNADAPRRIRLCADDYGISPGVNHAIRDLVARRRVNTVSAMVVAPHFSAAEADTLAAAASNHAAIGLHLTLTGPFKPLSQGFAPLADGAFLPLAATMVRAHLRMLHCERMRIEIAGQIEAFTQAFGRAPDFIDGHQHVQLFPQVSETLLQVVKSTKRSDTFWLRQCGRALSLRQRLADPKALLLDVLSARFRRLAARANIKVNSAFAGAYTFDQDTDYAKLFPSFLDHLPDSGVVMCHPGRADSELRRLDPLTDLREREYEFFLSDDFLRLLQDRGFVLA
ncbi:MAG TPA: ChbG/HpnK family deacetylase [Xanthobacteraceae bacterium]|jgi:hypothetical protein|nr:ChbG/HpnK family deacetylase [Xanthobacteraceae bacterium]